MFVLDCAGNKSLHHTQDKVAGCTCYVPEDIKYQDGEDSDEKEGAAPLQRMVKESA